MAIPKHSRLTPIRYVEYRKRKPFWLYQCSCGKKKIIDKYSVEYGQTVSCGCYKKEVLDNYNKHHRSFGNKSREGIPPSNKGKIRIHKIPNDPKSPFRYVTEQELTQIYHGLIDEGF